MKKLAIVLIPILIYSLGCKKDQDDPINLPVASFTISSEISRPGKTINFQNTSENATTFEWDFGDGNTSSIENPSHVYTEAGTYTIKLMVSNPDGSDEASNSLMVSYWSNKTFMPTRRWLLNTCVVNGKIYAIGGGPHYGKGALASIEEYDPETDTWSTKSDMPTPRQEPASSVVDGKIYVIGGGECTSVTGCTEIECYATVEEYDPVTDVWTEKSPIPTARWLHTACTVDGKIYVIGGINSSSNSDYIEAVEIYDPATDTWTVGVTVPRPMVLIGSAVVGGKIYVMGGGSEGYGKRVDEYDPITKTWTSKAKMLSSRSDFGCSVLNEKIYVIGGDQGYIDIIVDFLEIYDPTDDTWTAGVPMFTARVGLSSCTVGKKIYAIGGLSEWRSLACNFVEEYYE